MKALVFAVIVIVMASSVTSAFAQQPQGNPVEKISEYEIYKKINTLSDNLLLAEGFTVEQIKEARAFDYETHLRKLAELDDEALRNARYTDKQIQTFRNFNGSEEQMEILSATLLLWSGYEGSYYSADPTGQSWVRMWVSWAWQGVPGGYWTDRFVYLWSHDFTLDRAQVASYADVNYYYESVYGYWATEKVYPLPAGSTGKDWYSAEFNIPMRKAINGLWCRALDGTARIRVYDHGPKNSINAVASYAHRSALIGLFPDWSVFGLPNLTIVWGGSWHDYHTSLGLRNLFTGMSTFE